MKILFVGFQPYENITYPHLKQVVQYFSTLGGEYSMFRERGYFLDECFRPGYSIRSWVHSVYTLATIAIDSLKLVSKHRIHKYDLVVTVDNFAFIVGSLIFKNVVLWSHDFVTEDQERSRTWIHRLLKRKVSAYMSRGANIIIQDETRLSLFRTRYIPEGKELVNAFFLPVSLMPLATTYDVTIERTTPVLLQIGGINAWRSMSDKLLEHYQANHSDYELALHGFIDKDMTRRIRRAAYLPWVSSIDLDAESVNKIVEKCDIGFIAYNTSDLNFYYIARASGQLVEYLRCARPIIVFGNTTLSLLVEEEDLGVAISDLAQLSNSINKIVFNYSRYSLNCKRLYNEIYNLESYLPNLTGWLMKMANQ